MPGDDLERQVSELTDALAGAEQRCTEAEERWTAGLRNFAGQLEEAFGRGEERGWARGWADCARHFGLPLDRGRHRARRHLSAIPGGAAGVAAAAAWRLAGTAKTATSATAVLVRHTAHSATVTGVAAAGVAAAAGVTVALAPPASHALAAPPVASRAVPATMPAPPVGPWRPVRAPAGVSVASAAPDPSRSSAPVTAPVAAAPVTSAAAPVDTPPVSDPVPQASVPVSVPAVAAAVAPVTSRVRHRLHGLEHAVDKLADPGTYTGHHRRALPVQVPSAIPVPVPSVSLPSILGG
jgi:hypothetical protein